MSGSGSQLVKQGKVIVVKSVKTTNTGKQSKSDTKSGTGSRGNSGGAGGSTLDKVLGKLDGAQLVSAAGSLVDLAGHAVNLLTEKEKTAQAQIEQTTRFEELRIEENKSERDFNVKMTEVNNSARQARDAHDAKMAQIAKSIMRYEGFEARRGELFAMLKAGEITPEQCNEVLRTLHDGPVGDIDQD